MPENKDGQAESLTAIDFRENNFVDTRTMLNPTEGQNYSSKVTHERKFEEVMQIEINMVPQDWTHNK